MTHVVHLEDGSHPPYLPLKPVYEALPHRVPPLLVGPGQTFVESDDDDEIHYRLLFIRYQ
jgi:hypothetical protein